MTPPSRAQRRVGVAPRWVLSGLALSLVGALLVAVTLYRHFVAFERRAAEHLIGDPALVVRLDLEHVSLYSPFHEHVLPLVTQGQPQGSMKPRLLRLKQHSGVELGVDIRELVFSRGALPDSWAIAVAGMFPPQGVVSGIHQVLREEGRSVRFDAGLARLSFDNGVLLEQAADSVLVFASDEATLKQALVPSPRYAALGLGKSDPSLSVVVAGVLLGRATSETLGATHERLRLNGWVDQRAPERLTLDLTAPEGADSAPALRAAGRPIAKILAIPETAIRFEVSGPNRYRASIRLSGDQLGRAADHLAQGLRAAAFSAR